MIEASGPAGVLTGFEGLVLQRGGIELGLVKVGDRFTVRLQQEQTLAALEQAIGPRAVQSRPALNLVEIEVEPAQLEEAMQVARELSSVRFASHVYQLRDGLSSEIFLTDELTVQFAADAALEPLKLLFGQLGLHAPRPLAGMERAAVFQVGQRAPLNPLKLSNLLMRRAEVLLAEPNIALRLQPFYQPKATDYSQQWYLNHSAEAGEESSELAAGSHIAVEAAWDITRGVRSVAVAIADRGFDLSHPDFQGMGKIAFPKDLANPSGLPTTDSIHGTVCAQLAIAEETGTGRVGVAPGCTFVPIGMPEELEDGVIERLCGWVVETEVAVLSCGWGASASCYPLSLRQRLALSRAATEGRSGRGCVLVFAAGNANRPVCGTVREQGWPDERVHGDTRWLNGFAVHPDVMAVAACTSLNQKAAYSNWGQAIAIAAPGHNAPPAVDLEKTSAILTGPLIERDFLGRSLVPTPTDAEGDRVGGTSCAGAIVAGVAALVLSANPELSAIAVRRLLQDTADKLVELTPDPQLGLRHGTYGGSGHSGWFGYGKVNAHRAVFMANQMRSRPIPTAQRVRLSGVAPLPIPDAAPQGVTSLIHVTHEHLVQDIQLFVEIEHEYLGDIEITLVPPSGKPILLQGRSHPQSSIAQLRYTVQTTPRLRDCLQTSAQGEWQLRIVDCALGHVGTLKAWALDFGI